MRINVYSQELVLAGPMENAVRLVAEQADTGVVYSGVRIFQHSSDRLHHTSDDDDRSAITFWLPRSENNRKALAAVLNEAAALVLAAPSETGLD